MSFIANLRKALEVNLALLSPKPAIVWENVPYKPAENTPFIACYILTARSELADLQWEQENRGIFQIDIFVPLEKGTAQVNEYMDDLIDLYKAKTLINGGLEVRIGAPSPRYAGRVESFFQGSVDIPYVCYSS